LLIGIERKATPGYIGATEIGPDRLPETRWAEA